MGNGNGELYKNRQQEVLRTNTLQEQVSDKLYDPMKQPEEISRKSDSKSVKKSFVSVPKVAWYKTIFGGSASKKTLLGDPAKSTDAVSAGKKDAPRPLWMGISKEELNTKSIKNRDERHAEMKAIAEEEMASETYSTYSVNTQNLLKAIPEVMVPGGDYNRELKIVDRVCSYMDNDQALEKLNKQEKACIGRLTEKYKGYKGGLDTEKEMKKPKAQLMDMSEADDQFTRSEDLKKPLKYMNEKTNKMAEVNKRTGVVQKMKWAKHSIFSHEPNISDIVQGKVGDCYMLGALGSICEKNPEYIKKCMKDEGDNVVVRFYKKDGSPLLVRVSKAIPQWKLLRVNKKTGREIDSGRTENVFSKSALWVQYLEKAYSFARPEIEGWKKKDPQRKLPRERILDEGTPEDFYMAITGKKLKEVELPGGLNDKKKTGISSLVKDFHYGEKERYKAALRRRNKTFTDRDWNIYKAEKFFGVKINDKNKDQYKAFQKNKVFNTYEKYMKNLLKEFFTAQKFATTNEAEFFIQNIDRSKMPNMGIRGLDDDRMKEHFIGYFREYLRGSGKLFKSVNRTGKYTDEEKRIFRSYKNMFDNNRSIVTATHDLPIGLKK